MAIKYILTIIIYDILQQSQRWLQKTQSSITERLATSLCQALKWYPHPFEIINIIWCGIYNKINTLRSIPFIWALFSGEIKIKICGHSLNEVKTTHFQKHCWQLTDVYIVHIIENKVT